MEDVIIIGAGISGILTGYLLKKKNIDFKIVEAQNRLGGRIHTVYGNNETPMEMGATWFSKEHHNLLALLSEIGVGYFEQHTEGITLLENQPFEPPHHYVVPPNTHSSYRVQGGTYSIIHALTQQIGKERIQLHTEIIQIIEEGDHLKLIDNSQNTISCNRLVIAMPPRIIANKIDFVPALPKSVTQIMENTQTWMSGSIKFSVEYKRPFWLEKGFSGTAFSQSRLASEMYDHSHFEKSKFALKGFLNGSAAHYSEEERKEKAIAQLTHYFGPEAQSFLSYTDKIWDDSFIHTPNDWYLSAHQNNGHPVLIDAYMNNKIAFTGTETSRYFGGYMEGAVIAANRIANDFT